MKRRRFLRQAGVTAIASGGVLASARAQASESADVVSEKNPLRRVLVTSSYSPVARAIAGALAVDYDVQLTTAPSERATRPVFAERKQETNIVSDESLVQDMDAIVHVAQPPAGFRSSSPGPMRRSCFASDRKSSWPSCPHGARYSSSWVTIRRGSLPTTRRNRYSDSHLAMT